jgi:hypothetical protein
MHIIFGNEQAEQLKDKYTVLELDTFQIGQDGPIVVAYCAVETVPFGELFDLENLISKHNQLVESYRQQQWENCVTLVDEVMGKWGGTVDTFYQDLRSRADMYKKTPPDTTWTPVILKPTS